MLVQVEAADQRLCMKTWQSKHKKVIEFEKKNKGEVVLGNISCINPVILTTRQAKFVRDCLVKAYNPRKALVISKVSLSCIGFRHRGEILWMTNIDAMLHDTTAIKKKNRNEAAEILAWPFLGHYQEIIDRMVIKSSSNFKDFGHPNKLITAEGSCTYLTPPKGDIKDC